MEGRGRRLWRGFNDLQTLFPEVATFWGPSNDLEPSEFLPTSNAKVWWICDLGHEYDAKIFSKTISGHGCRICSGKQVLAGFNDLATLRPDIASEWGPGNSRLPSEVTVSSGVKVRWRCGLGHVWPATVGSRTSGNGCSTCSNKVLLVGFNDLATTHPVLAAEWNSQVNVKSPTEVVSGARDKVSWICSEGHVWRARVSDRSAGSGCPDCVSFHQSKAELKVWSRLSDLGLDVETAASLPGFRRGSIDALLREEKVALEYDGAYWHGRPADLVRDTKKTHKLLDGGWSVVRIRERGLPDLGVDDQRYVSVERDEVSYSKAAMDAVAVQVFAAVLLLKTKR